MIIFFCLAEKTTPQITLLYAHWILITFVSSLAIFMNMLFPTDF